MPSSTYSQDHGRQRPLLVRRTAAVRTVSRNPSKKPVCFLPRPRSSPVAGRDCIPAARLSRRARPYGFARSEREPARNRRGCTVLCRIGPGACQTARGLAVNSSRVPSGGPPPKARERYGLRSAGFLLLLVLAGLRSVAWRNVSAA
ncbi:hypothetical protein SKAU_G00311790 [Synaphobranchus kaupii]|uniref:Uncharacterized protein n=1 Tax=Synaphobranchus kaupii TaxID=118154 RepID=A0A9Q1ERT6_SYNKA|nr:hypothetical protein SKAU_G00311790 [Synaphobranchus kaupii]